MTDRQLIELPDNLQHSSQGQTQDNASATWDGKVGQHTSGGVIGLGVAAPQAQLVEDATTMSMVLVASPCARSCGAV